MKGNKPNITLIGIGVGNIDYLTEKAKKAIQISDLLLGAERLIETVRPINGKGKTCGITQVEAMIDKHPMARQIGILVSGDVGFYSLANTLRLKLGDDYSITQISGISSIQYFMNALGKRYENLCTVSMHGRNEQFIAKLTNHQQVFVLTGGVYSVDILCQILCNEGFGDATVYVGERLSYDNEKITVGRASELNTQTFDPLAVMLVEHKQSVLESSQCPGIPDEFFIRGKVPMTKSEIRAISLSKLQLSPTDIVYDVGAGTGSVSIEMARQVPYGKVYALERKVEGIELIEANKLRFQLDNIQIIYTRCPEGMEELPAPDAVFIGGSSGELESILECILAKNPKVKLVINAITLETLTEALNCFKKYGFSHQDITQVTVANSKNVGNYHLMMGQNPIFIISGQGGIEGE